MRASGDPRATLAQAIMELKPELVLDLSDEPVLDNRRRHEMAAVALWHEVPYRGADFRFWPPRRPALATKPSMAIIGTGKRTGKTAIAGYAARTLNAAGLRPIVVAMGRGGPEEPEVLRGDQIELTPSDLSSWRWRAAMPPPITSRTPFWLECPPWDADAVAVGWPVQSR